MFKEREKRVANSWCDRPQHLSIRKGAGNEKIWGPLPRRERQHQLRHVVIGTSRGRLHNALMSGPTSLVAGLPSLIGRFLLRMARYECRAL